MNLLNYYEQDGFCANMLLIHGYTSKDKKKIMNDYSFLTDEEATELCENMAYLEKVQEINGRENNNWRF